MDELFLLGGFFFVASVLFPVLVLLGLLIILALRRDDDPDGSRGPAIYASIVAVISVFTLLFAVTAAVDSLLDLTKDDDMSLSGPSEEAFESDFEPDFESDFSSGFGGRDPDDAAASGVVLALIVGAVAAGVLYLHRPVLERVRAGTGAAARVWRAYGLVVALLSLIIAIGAAVGLAYSIYGILAPGVSGVGTRGDAARTAGVVAVLGLGATALFRWHADESGILPKPVAQPEPPVPPGPPVMPTDVP